MDVSSKSNRTELNSVGSKLLLESKNEADTKDIPEKTEKPKKPRRRDKSDLGENFIAPDGGVWAWLVCIAAGVSNLSIYPCLQQFGFLFRQRLFDLGLSSSEVTTIFNTNNAVSSITGLLNGPMFRRFSFRQVAMAASLLIFIGISLSAFSENFIHYLISYSILYGFGMGISVSASALAINTYFKNKRRHATGFSWTITGLGPIFIPHIITFLLVIYEVHETVLIFAAFSLHSFVSALIYQPAQFHAPKPDPSSPSANQEEMPTIIEPPPPPPPPSICEFCELQQHRERKNSSIFSSQYLYQEDDEDLCGYEIIEPGTPMMSRANDGWFGSKHSIASHAPSTPRFRTISSCKDIENGLTVRLNKVSEEDLPSENFFKPNYFKRERDEVIKRSSNRIQFTGEESTMSLSHCTCAEERALMDVQATMEDGRSKRQDEDASQSLELKRQQLSFLHKVVVFFDLDLLRDFTYVNLVAGLTAINFGELNFSILVPFILKDYGFTMKQITIITSVFGSTDLLMRFLVPFITQKISWDNRVFFLIGIVGIALGRTVVACSRSFDVIFSSFVVIGIFKGVRTIFWPLIIPSYVPLKRLPAASGLQLLITGLFTLAAGPFVGIIRDHYNYSVVVHCLNALSFFAALSWILEVFVRRYIRRRSRKE